MCVKYISLGEWCISSLILKNMNLKTKSYPLDWIFSNQNIINDVFIDNKNIFEKSNLILKDGKTYHKVYGNIFNHHNPLLNSEHFQYFQRRIDDVNSLKTDSDICFIYITHAYQKNNILIKKLLKKYNNAKILYIYGSEQKLQNVVDEKYKTFGIVKSVPWIEDNWNLNINNDIQKIENIIRTYS